MSGKWHLGYKTGHLPVHRGFDKSWALLPGCSNHFGWEPQYEKRPRVVGHQPPIYVDQDRLYKPCVSAEIWLMV